MTSSQTAGKSIYPQGPVEKLYPEAYGKAYPAVPATNGAANSVSKNTAKRYGKGRG